MTIRPARTFELAGFGPARVAHPGPARLSFTIRQPSGKPLTTYRTGAGPHTGVHVIVVRDDLGTIIHRHPPIGAGGRIVQPTDFPSPGPYRVLVDALLFSSKPLYGRYAHPADPLFGISPLTDQRLAGVVMMTEQLLTLGICVALLLRPYLRERRTRAHPAFS